MVTKEDMIAGDKFERIAEKLGILFALTKDLPDLMVSIRQQAKEVFVMSHSCIGGILPPGMIFRPRDVERFEDFEWNEDVPSNIKYWFAQNCVAQDDRLIPIPLGVERDVWTEPQRKKDIMLAVRNSKVLKRGLIYLNVTLDTNRWRTRLYELFEDKAWCTLEGRVDFQRFAQQVSAHKFILSPEGNGMEAHRTWEALYLRSFPIVQRRHFTETFAKLLPILVVDDWQQVTKEFLEEKYQEFVTREWNWEALKIGYWENLIRGKLNA